MRYFSLFSVFLFLLTTSAWAGYFKKERLIVERNSTNQHRIEVDLNISAYRTEYRTYTVFGPNPSCGYDRHWETRCSWVRGHYFCRPITVERMRSCSHSRTDAYEVVENPSFGKVHFIINFDPKALLKSDESERFQVSYDHDKQRAYVLIKSSRHDYEKDDYGVSPIDLNQTAVFDLRLD